MDFNLKPKTEIESVHLAQFSTGAGRRPGMRFRGGEEARKNPPGSLAGGKSSGWRYWAGVLCTEQLALVLLLLME